MFLYIDPGTGSMLFAILIGIVGILNYLIRSLIIKFKSAISNSKVKIDDDIIPFLIYSEGKRYFYIFEPILNELESRSVETSFYTSSKDDPVFERNYKYIHPIYIGEGNMVFAKLNFVKAKVMLATTPGLDVYQWKRSRDVNFYIHIFHAANDVTLYKMFGIDYYDALILSGVYQIEDVRQLEKIRKIKEKELFLAGIPYMDELLKRYNSTNHYDDKVILVAPTWGTNSLLNKFGTKLIDKLLETEYEIVIRPHPQSYYSETNLINNLQEKYKYEKKISWNRDADNFDILNRASIMISDYSGVIFDFSLVFNKPVIYANSGFDLGQYDAWWLNKELWTIGALKRMGDELTLDNIDEINAMISKNLNNNNYIKVIDKIREETWANVGNSTKLIVDYIISKLELNK